MKRIRSFVAASSVLCAFLLAGAWWAVCEYADRQARTLLGHSREGFIQRLETTLDGVLWYAAGLAAGQIGQSAEPRSVEEMGRIAKMLWVDEVTVVGTNGIAVSSNFKAFVGFDWHTTPETAAFLALLDPTNRGTKLMQPFRRCAIRHDSYLKFGAVALPNRQGLVQVGFSMERLVQTFALSDVHAFNRWTFGRYGRFGAVDLNHNEIPDHIDHEQSSVFPQGRIRKIAAVDGNKWRLTFPFAGHLFYAEVPEREFGDERNAAFVLAAVVIVLLLFVFVTLIVRLRLSSERLEKMHREADLRAAEDLHLAHTIQMSTLPSAGVFNPDCLAYGFEALMLPAREVGGDLYDFFVLADGRIAFVIGDVSGKGVPAAMFMLLAKNAIRQALHEQGDPAVAMAVANASLCVDNAAEMFVTMVLGVLDPASGEVTYVNAGHTRPFVLRADGSVERLEARGGRLLGLFPKIEYRASHLRLATGDRMLLYTDGVTEAQDAKGRLYGEARLRALLATAPVDLCQTIRADVAQHVAEAAASDDLTLLVLAWRGVPERTVRVFPADDASIRQALDFLREVCPFSKHPRFPRLLQIVDELVSNVVNYSGSSSFSLEVETCHDRCKMVFTDDGREYNPLVTPEPDIHAPIQSRSVGGLGLLLIRNIADFISWRRENGQNRLTVVQYMRKTKVEG